MMRKALVLAMTLMAAAPSFAQAQTGSADQQDACRPDVRRFCYKVRPEQGDGAFLDCLRQNREKLSPKCRQVLESFGF
jgi:hypothetical protein